MSILHRLSLVLSGVLLRLCLFFGFTILAMVIVFGNPNSIKDALSSTNAYSHFTDAIIEAGRQQSVKNSEDIPFDDPEIQKIIRNSFDQQTLKTDTDTALDSIYSWLNGKTLEPSFSIDLTDNKKKLANGLADYAINRLASLPVCRSFPAQTNIYRIDCQPIYLDVKAQRETVYNAIMNDNSFLKDNVITFDTLVKDNENQDYHSTPDYFKWFKRLPWVLFTTAIILSAYIVLSSRSRRIGMKKVGSVLISTGIALAIAPIIASFITPTISKNIQNGLSGSTGSINAVINDVSNHLYAHLNTILINIAIQVLIAGIVIMIALRFTRPTTPYRGVRKKSGLSSSMAKPMARKGLSEDSAPIQTSERKAKTRKPSSIKSKYRKI